MIRLHPTPPRSASCPASPRECPRCRHDLSEEEIECPHCSDDRSFRFPPVHALALFVAGAIPNHFYPDVGTTLIRLAGYGETIPQQ